MASSPRSRQATAPPPGAGESAAGPALGGGPEAVTHDENAEDVAAAMRAREAGAVHQDEHPGAGPREGQPQRPPLDRLLATPWRSHREG